MFDADAPGPRATKATFAAAELAAPEGAYIRIDGAVLEPGRAAGELSTPELQASWDLSFEDPGEPFHHLPYERLYDAPLPRTKFLSPYPSARFDGTVTVGGERIEIADWPGMIGHNWGAEHAERWVWIQGGDLAGQRGSYLDLAAGRIKIGPVTTPWVANGMLRIDGSEHRLGGFDRILSTKLDEQPTSCEFQLSGKDVKLRGRVSAEPRNFVAWVYADPKGPEHNTLNCSIADLELELGALGSPAGAARAERRRRPTRSGCARPITASRSSRIRTASGAHLFRNRAQVLRRFSAGLEPGSRDPGAPARADHARRDDPRGVPALQDLDLSQPAGKQPGEPRLDLVLRVPRPSICGTGDAPS